MSEFNLRDKMPKTAAIVDAMRKEYGIEYTNTMIRRAMNGEKGFFFACENGHTLGTDYADDERRDPSEVLKK